MPLSLQHVAGPDLSAEDLADVRRREERAGIPNELVKPENGAKAVWIRLA